MDPVERFRDHKKLEEDMYDIANKIVGNVGPKVKAFARGNNRFIETIPEPLAFFGLKRMLPLDESEIMDIWEKWIKAYCMFKKYHVPEKARHIDDPDLIICWFKEPTAEITHWFIPKMAPYIYVSAYLNIERVDCRSNL